MHLIIKNDIDMHTNYMIWYNIHMHTYYIYVYYTHELHIHRLCTCLFLNKWNSFLIWHHVFQFQLQYIHVVLNVLYTCLINRTYVYSSILVVRLLVHIQYDSYIHTWMCVVDILYTHTTHIVHIHECTLWFILDTTWF